MMTAEQLKVSLYLLLFSGKLTEQLADDGTAKELLKKIEKMHPASKKALRIIKKESGDYYEVAGTKETCISDELLFDIPDNWAWVHLNEIAVSGLGKTLNKAKDIGDTKQYLCSINVYWDGIHLDEIKEAKFSESDIEKYKLIKGDLLICEGGDAGRTAIWEYENEMYYQNALHRVRFWEGIDPYYFRALMEFYKLNGTIDSYCKGMTIKHLVQGSLNAMRFPLPPLAEQKRIVAKIKELMPFVEQYEAASTKLNTLNASFPEMMKKSILQEAVQGKLVPQDPNDEPASLLLKRIAREQQELIKSGKLRLSGKINKTAEIELNIPGTWEKAKLKDLIAGKVDNRGKTPLHNSFRDDEYCIDLLEINSLVPGQYITHANVEKFITKKIYDSLRGHVRKDDILIATVGSLGKFSLMDDTNSGIAQNIIAIRFCKGINPRFVFYLLQSPYFEASMSAIKMEAVQASIKVPDLFNIIVPLPPTEEQNRIVEKIDEIMTPVMNELDKLKHQ